LNKNFAHEEYKSDFLLFDCKLEKAVDKFLWEMSFKGGAEGASCFGSGSFRSSVMKEGFQRQLKEIKSTNTCRSARQSVFAPFVAPPLTALFIIALFFRVISQIN
jgi:hypothetical protein